LDRPDHIRYGRARAVCAALLFGLSAAGAFAASGDDADSGPGLRPSLPASGSAGKVAQTNAYGSPPGSGASSTGYVSMGEQSGRPKKKKKTAKTLSAPASGLPLVVVPDFQPGQKMNPRIGSTTPVSTVHKRPVEEEPFGPVGFHAGAFLLKPSLEVSEGYDSNPFRVQNGAGSAFTTINGALSAKSEWSRHEMQLDLRGSYNAYSDVEHANRPDADARLRGRIDIAKDLRIEYDEKAALSTQAPGQPDSITGAKQLPFIYTLGSSTGVVKQFNRLELGAYGEVSRTIYEDADLLNGTTLDLSDFTYNDYTARLRGSYEITPGLKPFVEVAADTRVFDNDVNSFGIRQGSNGYKAEAGVIFDRPDLIKGQFGLGYIARNYDDPTLPDISGLLIDSSLLWKPTALTQVKLDVNSTINESITTGAAGIFTREGKLTVDHAFRRWLIASLFAGYGTDQYRGTSRVDDRWTYGAALTYSLNRALALRGEIRREKLDSSDPTQNYTANIVMLGLRLQR
jgi:hypothetical protein